MPVTHNHQVDFTSSYTFHLQVTEITVHTARFSTMMRSKNMYSVHTLVGVS